MSSPRHTRFFRNAMLAVWAMFTMILVFIVVILVTQMANLGHNPLAVSLSPPPPAPNAQDAKASEAREVPLFFGDADGKALCPESRRVEMTDSTVDNCRQVLVELIKGPKDSLTPIFPAAAAPAAGIRALYLLDGGELVVDLSHEILFDAARSSTCTEALFVYGIVNTLTQADIKGAHDGAVQKVLFLVDGSSPTERFATHLDLSRPIPTDSQWIATTAAPANTSGKS